VKSHLQRQNHKDKLLGVALVDVSRTKLKNSFVLKTKVRSGSDGEENCENCVLFSISRIGFSFLLCLLNDGSAQVGRSWRRSGTRTCPARQRVRVSVRCVGQAPGISRGTFEQLALPEAVAAGIPGALIGREVPYARGAGGRPIRQRTKSDSASVASASRTTSSRSVEWSSCAGLRCWPC
jgi:hypothetical protein